MSCGNQHEEIKTIRAKAIYLDLSEADCERLMELCGKNGISVSQLLENFIGDLVDGTYSNGSDKRMYAEQWFDRCGFSFDCPISLLTYLFREDAIDDYKETVDILEEALTEYADIQRGIVDFDDDELQCVMEDIDESKKKLNALKAKYTEYVTKVKDKNDVDWKQELLGVNAWLCEKEAFINE